MNASAEFPAPEAAGTLRRTEQLWREQPMRLLCICWEMYREEDVLESDNRGIFVIKYFEVLRQGVKVSRCVQALRGRKGPRW